MKASESTIREIKDRIAAAMGEVEETASAAERKDNHHRLTQAAKELHRCADDLQTLLMRIKPR